MPKDPSKNLEWRKEKIREGYEKDRWAEELRVMCSRDLLFYVNTFVWTIDPRLDNPVVPFITWGYQDELFQLLAWSLGHQDMALPKSRDMGLSWICVITLEWDWHFHDDRNHMFISRKEELVDDRNNPKSLMGKIDFVLDRQPHWIKPTLGEYDRKVCHLRNPHTNSVIDGEPTTGDMARGDRRTVILMDEFASVPDAREALMATRDATDCRWFNSTHKGQQTAFASMCEADGTVTRKVMWYEHPIKRRGLYRSKPHEIDILDPQFGREDYDWRNSEQERIRSPWYDKQCDRAAHPMEIKQEIDCDVMGSSYQFFSPQKIDTVIDDLAQPPLQVGDLDINWLTAKPQEFLSREQGPLRLWRMYGKNARPPNGRYVVGADISAGTGASNSVLSVGEAQNNAKVAEYVTPDIPPHKLAVVAVGLCRWFDEALLIWEANGPGQIFENEVRKLGYRHLYYDRQERSISETRSDNPGWYSTQDKKLRMLGQYRRALGREFVNRSIPALKEAKQYIYTQAGRVEHSVQATTEDPTAAKHNHGDRVIADGLCWKGLSEINEFGDMEKQIPENSLAARRQRRKQKQRQEDLY